MRVSRMVAEKVRDHLAGGALMPTLTLAEAEDLVVKTLTRCRTDADNAKSVARALVAAEAEGQKGHGLSRAPSYAAQAKVGKVDGFAKPALTWPRPAAAVIDAKNGFAYPAIDAALAALPRRTRAKRHRGGGHQSFAPLRRRRPSGRASGQGGAGGADVRQHARRDRALGRLQGGVRHQPDRLCLSAAGQAPIVVDLSLSKVARGNILAAKQKGEAIPDGWALDAEGKPTTDPTAALAGTMLPLGDAKGTALALMVELLAAGSPAPTLPPMPPPSSMPRAGRPAPDNC